MSAILVIDDERPIRNTLKEVLEYEKHDELIEYAKNLSNSRERSLADFSEDRPDRELKDRGPTLQNHFSFPKIGNISSS